jgi:hypothetical protein
VGCRPMGASVPSFGTAMCAALPTAPSAAVGKGPAPPQAGCFRGLPLGDRVPVDALAAYGVPFPSPSFPIPPHPLADRQVTASEVVACVTGKAPGSFGQVSFPADLTDRVGCPARAIRSIDATHTLTHTHAHSPPPPTPHPRPPYPLHPPQPHTHPPPLWAVDGARASSPPLPMPLPPCVQVAEIAATPNARFPTKVLSRAVYHVLSAPRLRNRGCVAVARVVGRIHPHLLPFAARPIPS